MPVCTTTDNIILRPGTKDDVEALYPLILGLAASEGKNLEKLPLTKENLERFGFGDMPHFLTELVEVNDRIIGYALYFFTFSACKGFPVLHIEDLFVTDACRGRGIGRLLMKKLARYALEKECCRMEWHVFDWNTSAMKFYELLGAGSRKDLIHYRLERAGVEQLAK